MKKTNKQFINIILISFILITISTLVFKIAYKKPQVKTIKPTIKSANMKIMADGMVRSQNEIVLHFATGGKLVYLPVKEGSRVYKGQTIASLDSYVLQRQLTAALNNYRSVRDSFDQLNDNNANNYLDAQQANPYPYNYWNLAGISGIVKTDAVNDMIKRLVDQAQAGLDNSVIQVEIANYVSLFA
jgi:multidrug efflux pump subunit AcrA (membrane-fusion protein)